MDDDAAARTALAGVLEEAHLEVVGEAGCAREAIELAVTLQPTVAVIDVSLGDGGGAEVARRIRQDGDQRVDVIACASFSEVDRVAEMVSAGAAAYVIKSRPQELVGAVRAVSAGSGLLSAEASRPVLEEVARLYERERSRNEELEQTVAQLQALSVTDWLTGLKNHGYFFDRLSEELARARRFSRPLAVVLADLDDFKAVNDAHGHAAGDQVLRMVGEVLRTQLRVVDIACRVGGEEFGLILPDTGAEGAILVSERLREEVERRCLAGVGSITLSLGVAAFPDHALGRDELTRVADQALYLAKRQGKNCTRVIDERLVGVEFLEARRPDSGGPVVRALLGALRMRAPHLADRSERLAEMAIALGGRLALAAGEVEHLRLAALLHDVGMLGVPDSVLFKPGPLSQEEWRLMQTHPEDGYALIVDAVHPDVAQAVLAHHERADGSGYPQGLASQEIPFLARALMVLDTYQAMVTERPYQRALRPQAALEELQHAAGVQFDAGMVEALVETAIESGWVQPEPTTQVVQFPAASVLGA
ncbi:MAG: diguanylate cyclase [Actinomycetota bacterium]|nr:diguanylate cyclase [Actinomycetota bacterium]